MAKPRRPSQAWGAIPLVGGPRAGTLCRFAGAPQWALYVTVPAASPRTGLETHEYLLWRGEDGRAVYQHWRQIEPITTVKEPV